MAKSTAAAALASLQHKFQVKIREVGSLKACIKRLTSDLAEGVAQSEVVQKVQTELNRQRLRAETLATELLKSDKSLSLMEARALSAEKAYARLTGHVKDLDGRQRDLKADVSSWKSFVATGTVLGVAVGVLGTVAYFAQTAPL